MQTFDKHYCNPSKCALDYSVSLNVMSRNYDAFAVFPPKTTVNGFKYIAGCRKTLRAATVRQHCAALTDNAMECEMADSFPRQILPYLEGSIGELRKMRFWSKVDVRGPDECWDWKASKGSNGYGRFKIASYTTVLANRFALISTKGIEPFGMMVLHSCDRPVCCNPRHLRFGSGSDNVLDRVSRGRGSNGGQSGIKNSKTKLTLADISAIVDGLKAGKGNCEIAREVGNVQHYVVSRVRLGHSWQAEAAALGWPEHDASQTPHLGSVTP